MYLQQLVDNFANKNIKIWGLKNIYFKILWLF